MSFWGFGMHDLLSPFKRMRRWIVGGDEAVNGLSQFPGGRETGPLQSVSCQEGKPYLYLIHPACVRRDEMQMNIFVPREPQVPLRFMRAEVVHDDMDCPVRMGAHYAVHKIQELDSSSSLVMPGDDLTGGRFEGREEGGRAMPLVLMREALKRPPVRQFQVPLSALQRLDVRFLIYAKHQRILRRIEIQSDNIRCLFSKLRVGAYTPTPPPLKLDAVTAQHLPYKISRKRQCPRQQRPVPLAITGRRRLVQHPEDTLLVVRQVSSALSRPRGISETIQSQPGEPQAPLGHRGRPSLHLSCHF